MGHFLYNSTNSDLWGRSRESEGASPILDPTFKPRRCQIILLIENDHPSGASRPKGSRIYWSGSQPQAGCWLVSSCEPDLWVLRWCPYVLSSSDQSITSCSITRLHCFCHTSPMTCSWEWSLGYHGYSPNELFVKKKMSIQEDSLEGGFTATLLYQNGVRSYSWAEKALSILD